MKFDNTILALTLPMIGLKLTMGLALIAEGDALGGAIVCALAPFSILWALQS